MRRVIFLLVIVLILLCSAFMIGLGWYLYIPQKISQMIGIESVPAAEIEAPAPVAVANETAKVRIKIGEMAAYRKEGNAIINVTLSNLDSFSGNARIIAALYYAQKAVANKSIIVDFRGFQTKKVSILINPGKEWNAFDVMQG